MKYKIKDIQSYIGKKLPETHITILEDLGRSPNGNHYFKIQCECSNIKQVPFKSPQIAKTCGQKTCMYFNQLNAMWAKNNGKMGGLAMHKKAILLEDNEYQFRLAKSTYSEYIAKAKTRNLQWFLEPQDLKLIWIEQNGKCKITGMPLSCGTGCKDHTWSLDRIDNNKHYTKDNVQIVSKIYNMVKSTRTDEEMKLLAYLISQNLDYEQLRKYNSMSKEEINNLLKQCTRINRK
jgi:hypothetical protein